MKHYISFQEASGYFSQEIIKGDLPSSVDGEQVLLNNLRDNHIFAVLQGGSLLFQKETLLSHHRNYAPHQHVRKVAEPKSLYMDHFISTLSLKYYDDGKPGIPIVEDIVCDYMFEFDEFKRSLKHEGVYGILNCVCEDIYCGGLFLEVRHYGQEVVGWVLAYYQERYPRTYLQGLLFNEQHYYRYLALQEKLHYWEKSEQINHLKKAAKEVWIQLPLFFARKQLQELL